MAGSSKLHPKPAATVVVGVGEMMTDLSLEILGILNRHRTFGAPEVGAIDSITASAFGWKLSRQVYEALVTCGFVEQRLLTCNLSNPTSADAVYLSDLHVRIMARFNQTLNAYQGHFRVVERLNNQLVQPLANLGKMQDRFDKVDAEVKKAGDNVPEKLRGQFGAANGELKKAQQRVDAVQQQIDAEFARAAADKPAFMRARLAEEYTRSISRVAGFTEVASLLWLQHAILGAHKWNPAAPAFTTVVNRYL